MIAFFQHCLLIHMNRCLKSTEFIRKEFVINHIKKSLNKEVFPKFLQKLMYGSVRVSAIFMSHRCPFSVVASQTHCANRDCCWRRAPVTGLNKRETTLSEIVTVQMLIQICQHRLPAPLTVWYLSNRVLNSFSQKIKIAVKPGLLQPI